MRRRFCDGIIVLDEEEFMDGLDTIGFEGIIIDSRYISDRINVFVGRYKDNTDKYILKSLATIYNDRIKTFDDLIKVVKATIELDKCEEFQFGIPEIAVTKEISNYISL